MINKRMIVLISIISLFWHVVTPLNPSHAQSFDVSAKSAILIEQESGRVLYEKDAYSKRRIASITKIMTAIIAIESNKLDKKVKVPAHAVGVEGSSIYLEEHELITLEDLIYGLMLRSGNDAATAIASYIGGSEEGFVFLMNKKARELGMSNTIFANPHGLDDNENHYSTAYDMAILTQYAMKNEQFRKIFGAKNYKSTSLKGDKLRYWKNKNKLILGLYRASTGGKTGYTKRAKRTLVSTASKSNLDLIAVTLDAPSDWNDHISMFEHAFQTYDNYKLINSGKYKHIKHRFYKNKLKVHKPVYYPLTEDEQDNLQSSVTLYKPPKGEEWTKNGIPKPVGKLTIYLANEEIAAVPIFFDGSPTQKKATFFQKFKSIFSFILEVDHVD